MLNLAAEMAGVGTWHLSVLDNELYSSPECKEVLGLPANAQLCFQDFISVLHPDDRSLVEAEIAQALDPKGAGLFELDYRIQNNDHPLPVHSPR